MFRQRFSGSKAQAHVEAGDWRVVQAATNSRVDALPTRARFVECHGETRRAAQMSAAGEHEGHRIRAATVAAIAAARCDVHFELHILKDLDVTLVLGRHRARRLDAVGKER